MLDKLGRLFAMGRMLYGVTGLTDKDHPHTIVQNPTQVVKGLPSSGIVEIACGRFHSIAISKKGQVFSWGEGANCRLGLGFSEKTFQTPT